MTTWIDYKNGHIFLSSIYTNISVMWLWHSSIKMVNPLKSEFGHMTYYCPWDNSKHNASKSFKRTCAVNFAHFEGFWYSYNHHHVKKPRLAYCMMGDIWHNHHHFPNWQSVLVARINYQICKWIIDLLVPS